MTPAQFKTAREALGYSAEGFARRLGVASGHTIRRWEAGEREINGSALALVRLLLWLRDRGMPDPEAGTP